MSFNTQFTGLNELLSAIYGDQTHLDSLLRQLGFDPTHVELLQGPSVEVLVAEFLEAVHKRLTSESGQDTYYQMLSSRYGLAGDPPQGLEAIAQKRNVSPEYLRQLFEEIIQRCRSKSAQNDFSKSLRHIAVAQLQKMEERPSREQVAGKLKRLTNLRAAADVARMDYEAKRAEFLKSIQAELDALDSEYKPLLDSAEENIAALEAEIRTDVLLHGESVQAGAYRAVYTRGRISWDGKGIEQYATSHPEVLQYRRQGEATVALRAVSEK